MESRTFWNKNLKKFFSRNEHDEQGKSYELVVHPCQNDIDESSTSALTTNGNFMFAENLEIFFESDKVSTLLKDSSKVLLLKLEIKDVSNQLNSNQLDYLAKKCAENSIVIFLATKLRKNFFLHWKSKKILQFLTLKIYDECDFMNDLRLFEFIAKFLTDSLRRNHLGIHSGLKIEATSKIFQLHLFADHRNYNLLLIAAELGDIYIVHFLLDAGFSTESPDTNAQTLAYNGRHFDILSSLLKSNLTYPREIVIQECPDDIKDFHEISQSLNEAMMLKNSVKVLEILSQNQEMHHFYNLKNESAPAFALKQKLFDMYALMLSKDVRFGPHEKFSEIKETMKENERVILREIHYKESKFLPDNHMHVLLSNSRLAPATTQPKQKYEIIQKAYEILNENPFIQLILMVVAASRNFRVVFDFDRDSVEHIDPTADASMKGLFYLSGRIYIAVKQLLHPSTKFEALGTLAHELCHYAMNLVYKNMARPYFSSDLKTELEFENILKICEENHDKEEIIEPVFTCYPSHMQHAELIVRVPHLIMQYFNNPERIEEVRGIFGPLFEIFESKIDAEMREALPGIEAEAEVVMQKNKKKIRNLTLISIFIGLFAVVGIISGIFITRSIFYKRNYKFGELSVDEQELVARAPIIYLNMSLNFLDLFPKKSSVYEHLISDHISHMLNGHPLNFNDPHLRYLGDQVRHNWENLTSKLKQKFLNSNFTFQGESLRFQKLQEINSAVFSSLNSSQILDVLKGEKLTVHKMIENHTIFYVDMKIWDANMREIFESFNDEVNPNDTYLSIIYSSSERSNFFDNYYRKFVRKDFTTQLAEIKKIKDDPFYKKFAISNPQIYYYNWVEDILIDQLSFHKSLQFGFDHVLKIANESKLFILSAPAGTGKTVTFEQFTMRIKKKFPTQWVSYIDLKDHIHLYKEAKTLQNIKEILEMVFELRSENEFERKIFEDFFESGNVILLWDGFDEISPEYGEDVMRILGLISERTKNIQFVCTRPLYTDRLSSRFMTRAYTLVPFDEKEQNNFIQRFLVSKKIDELKIPDYVIKVGKIANATKSAESENFKTPLLLFMITDLVSSETEIYESENLYEIYRSFIEKKIQIWKQKSKFAMEFLGDFATKHRNFHVQRVYESYAMKIEFQMDSDSNAYFNFLKLKLKREKVPKELTNDEISRMGILYINGPKNFEFAHRSFAEFFIAQYLIENIYKADDEPIDREAELRIRILCSSIRLPDVRKFIDSFLQTKNANESKAFDPQISKQLKTNSQKLMLNKLEEYGTSIFPTMFNFFKKDIEVLRKLLQIDENETAYTAIFSYAFLHFELKFNPFLLKNLVRSYLTDDEYDKFIHGKNQKGIVLFSLYGINCMECHNHNFNISHDAYEIDERLLEIEDPYDVFEQIAKNLTKHEIKELLKAKVSVDGIYYYSETYSKKYLFHEKTWSFIENVFTVLEQKEILWNFFDIFSFMTLIDPENIKNTRYNLEKLSKYFSGEEIFSILSCYNALYKNLDSDGFNILWNFFVNYTTQEQQKTFLLNKKSKSLELNLPLNLLFHSVFNRHVFPEILKIYESYFNKTEMQEIILLNSSDFLPYLVANGKSDKGFLEYLKTVFAGNEKSLKNFILQKIEPAKLNVFELMNDFYDPYSWLQDFANLVNYSSNS